MSTFALAAYPISGAFRAELGEVELLVLPELRRLGPRALAGRLAALSGRCVIALEDPTSEALLPILEVVAAVTRARTIEIARPGGSRERISRARGGAHLLTLIAASCDAQVALRAARRDLDRLLSLPREETRVDGHRALFLNANLWFGVKAGGSITHVAGVVNALLGRGYEVELATAPDPVGVAAGVAIRRLQPPRAYGLPPEANVYRFGRSAIRQLDDVRRPSFVYQRHSVGSYGGAVVARALGVPLILEYNGSEIWVARHWGRPLRYERLALDAEEASLRHAHLVVTISQALADELLARGVEEHRIVWHPNGTDASRFAPERFSDEDRHAVRARYGIAADAVVVGFVGTFGQWHGADVLAQAIRANAQWARDNGVRFLLVGDGLKMPAVRETLAGAEDVAVLTGLVPQDEAPLHLAASDVVVSPHVPNDDGSPFFGSPTKLFEYMAAGKAIVASDLDQVGDVLRDGAGVLVPPGDASALGGAIVELAADAEQRRALGARARSRVLERYTWDHHVSAILAAI
jgi:glycosyltransferase involved in cell wall biosynthesis